MNIATKYLNKDEYDRDWEPKYQALEKKYFSEDGTSLGDSTEYNSEIEKLDYYYAQTISQRIQQRLAETLDQAKSALERNDYNDFNKIFLSIQELWKDFNTPFHYKMNARGILEKV